MAGRGWQNRKDPGRDPFNQNSHRSDREKWSTSKDGPVFSKLFRLDQTDPLGFGPKFLEILVEWIAPPESSALPFLFKEIFLKFFFLAQLPTGTHYIIILFLF